MNTEFHNAALIEAVEIMQEDDVIDICSLLTDEQVRYFELHLAKRREDRTH